MPRSLFNAPCLALLASLAGTGAYAQQVAALRCPPGSTLVTTGVYASQSCVGSNIEGLVEQTLPFEQAKLFGGGVTRPQDPIVGSAQRLPLPNHPAYAAGQAHIAATATELSAMDSPWQGISAKLAADWAFVFDGGRVAPGSRIVWMGGILSRSVDGSMRFSNARGFDAPIDQYRRNLPGFLAAVGPETTMFFEKRYGAR